MELVDSTRSHATSGRRGCIIGLLVFVVSLGLAVPGAVSAEGSEPVRGTTVDSVWIVARGAGSEASLKVTCFPEDRPVVLRLGISQDGKTVAAGSLSNIPCTGEPVPMIVAMAASAPKPRRAQLHVKLEMNYVGSWLDPWELEEQFAVQLERHRFEAPYDEDDEAELTLVRGRLTRTGAARLVHQLSCDPPGYYFDGLIYGAALSGGVSQVTRRGRTVGGGGLLMLTTDDAGFSCTPEPQRLVLVVSPPTGQRFRAGVAFVSTVFGDWYEPGVYATVRQPAVLAPIRRDPSSPSS